nr:MAG TPA: hypothetical protein [Caudoviricetes sp.]
MQLLTTSYLYLLTIFLASVIWSDVRPRAGITQIGRLSPAFLRYEKGETIWLNM